MYGSGIYGTGLYGAPAGESEPTAELIEETLRAFDQNDAIAITAILQRLSINDITEASLFAIILKERLAAIDSVLPSVSYFFHAYEALKFSDQMKLIMSSSISDNFTHSDTITANVFRFAAIIDSLAVSGSIYTGNTVIMAQTLALYDVLVRVQQESLTSQADINDAITAQALIYAELIEAIYIQATLDGMATFTVVVNEDVDIDSNMTAIAIYKIAIAEGLGFSVSLAINGVPYVGICMNALTHGITEYTNYNFNALANFKGVLFGTNETGLFRLEGDNDDGAMIDAYGRLPMARIANGKQARVDCAYIGYRSNGTLQLKATISDPAGDKVSYVYDLVEQPARTTRSGRIKLGRGMKSAYYGFELINTNGSDFAVDILEIHPLSLDRRIQ